MRKQENIYDLVERASARHAIPRLQLWQEAAKALTENELRVLNQSERLSPAGAPTIAKWLSDFRAAVDWDFLPRDGINSNLAAEKEQIIAICAEWKVEYAGVLKKKLPFLGEEKLIGR